MIAATLALRNLWRNRRRSVATLAAIAVGFAAINLFGGYIHDVYAGLQKSAIEGEALGHLTLVKQGYYEAGTLHPDRYLFSPKEQQQIEAVVREQPGLRLLSPRLPLSGLISNGKTSTIFIAEGIRAADAAVFWKDTPQHSQLPAGRIDAGLMSEGLAQLLSIQTDDTVALLASTLEGQTNALDFTVAGTWNTGNAGSNDKSLLLPLAHAQALLDTEGAARLILLYAPATDAAATRAALLPRLQAAGLKVEIKTWEELSAFYRQVKNLFDLIFLFLFSIVFTVALMSIVNTLSMSVMERVREIGTLRALGSTRAGIIRLFAVEGALLGFMGCVLGVALTLAVSFSINQAGIQYVPPSSSAPVPLTVGWVPDMLGFSLVALSLVSMLAAFWPARHAAKIEIVDALGHV